MQMYRRIYYQTTIYSKQKQINQQRNPVDKRERVNDMGIGAWKHYMLPTILSLLTNQATMSTG